MKWIFIGARHQQIFGRLLTHWSFALSHKKTYLHAHIEMQTIAVDGRCQITDIIKLVWSKSQTAIEMTCEWVMEWAFMKIASSVCSQGSAAHSIGATNFDSYRTERTSMQPIWFYHSDENAFDVVICNDKDCHRFLFSVSNENIHGKCSVASQYAAALANWKYNITLLAISGQLCGHFQIPCFLHIIILQFCRFSSLAERSNKNQTKKKKKLPKRIQSCVCFGECSFCVWSFLHFIVWCLVLELRIWVLPRRECFMHERWNSVCTTFSCSVRQRRFALWCNCWEKKRLKRHGGHKNNGRTVSKRKSSKQSLEIHFDDTERDQRIEAQLVANALNANENGWSKEFCDAEFPSVF